MPRTGLLQAALPALILASCASRPEGIPFLQRLPLSYKGRIVLAPREKTAPRRPGTVPASALKMEGPALEVEARVYSVDRDTLCRLLGLPGWMPAAGIVDLGKARAGLEALRAAGLAKSLSSPRTISWPGQEVRISKEGKSSYVRSFLLKQEKKAIVADPQVGTLRSTREILVEARPSRGRKGVDLRMELHLAAPPGPLPVLRIQSGLFPGGLSLQAPLLFFQDLAARASLVPGRGVLITGLESGSPGRGLAVLFWAREYPPPEGDKVSRAPANK